MRHPLEEGRCPHFPFLSLGSFAAEGSPRKERIMGEMADMALWEVADHENDRVKYAFGEIDTERAIELGVCDQFGAFISDGIRSCSNKKTCKYCKKGGLHWVNTDDGWRLSENGKIHECSQYFENRD
jgi:hypothetical protein